MEFKFVASLVAVAVAAALFTGCSNSLSAKPQTSSPNSTSKYVRITPEEAKNRMDKNPKAIILDVRTKDEFSQKHIPKAILVPNETIKDTPPAELPDKNAEILVYCRSGNRSKQAAQKLIAMGYTNVLDFGGIGDWPYETTK